MHEPKRDIDRQILYIGRYFPKNKVWFKGELRPSSIEVALAANWKAFYDEQPASSPVEVILSVSFTLDDNKR